MDAVKPASGETLTSAAVSEPVRQTEGHLRVADVLFIAMFGVYWLPWHLAPIEVNIVYLSYGLFFAATIALLWEWLVADDAAFSVIAAAIILIVVLLALYGVYEMAEPWLIGADAVVVGALAVGAIWAANRSYDDVARVFGVCWALAFWSLVGNIILLYLLRGTLDISVGGYEEKNLFAVPIWTASGMICSLSPFLYAITALRQDETPDEEKSFVTRQRLCWLSVVACTGVAFMTGTRTLIVVSAVTAFVLWRLRVQASWRTTAAVVVFCACIIAVATVSDTELTDSLPEALSKTYVMYKFLHKEIAQESRYTELMDMLDAIEGRRLIGMGFGTTFDVYWEGIDASYRSTRKMHLGGFCYLQKGGLLLFVALVGLPGVLAIGNMLAPTNQDLVQLACWGSILIYLVPALVATGGWEHEATFLYGIWLSVALERSRWGNDREIEGSIV